LIRSFLLPGVFSDDDDDDDDDDEEMFEEEDDNNDHLRGSSNNSRNNDEKTQVPDDDEHTQVPYDDENTQVPDNFSPLNKRSNPISDPHANPQFLSICRGVPGSSTLSTISIPGIKVNKKHPINASPRGIKMTTSAAPTSSLLSSLLPNSQQQLQTHYENENRVSEIARNSEQEKLTNFKRDCTYDEYSYDDNEYSDNYGTYLDYDPFLKVDDGVIVSKSDFKENIYCNSKLLDGKEDKYQIPKSLLHMKGNLIKNEQNECTSDEKDSDDPCVVCQELDPGEDNEMIYCEGPCGQCVHTHCYGLDAVPNGDFYCESCLEINLQKNYVKNDKEEKPRCVLCRKSTGMMKKSTCDRWVHLVCVLFTSKFHNNLQLSL
jgi:hypothetical protein